MNAYRIMSIDIKEWFQTMGGARVKQEEDKKKTKLFHTKAHKCPYISHRSSLAKKINNPK